MSNFAHQPVLLSEVLTALRPAPAGRYVDATIGGGGHAEAILSATSPTGWLFGCDRDGDAVEAVRERLRAFEGRFELRHGNFSELSAWLPENSFDGVLMDLGVSSPQLDRGERGFSFQHDGPLDMRMDQQQTLTAAEVVNQWPEEALSRMFWELGGEEQSRRLARAMVRARSLEPLTTTGQLASLIERENPRRGKARHPATKIFQALRLTVNDELGSLEKGLEAAVKSLRSGGRLAVITFHSLEDRRVKAFGRRWSQDYEVSGEVDLPEFRTPRAPRLRWVQRKAILPSSEEAAINPRSRSAQLRILEKI